MRVLTVTLAVGAILIFVTLGRRRDWSLASTVSEKPTDAANGGGVPAVAPISSASRFIALFGLLVLATVILGVGHAVIWGLYIEGRMPPLDGIGTYLAGGASLFAPYVVNQLKTMFTTTN